jgi:hypothetical protein
MASLNLWAYITHLSGLSLGDATAMRLPLSASGAFAETISVNIAG